MSEERSARGGQRPRSARRASSVASLSGKVADELVPGLPRVGLSLLGAIGEAEAEQGLGRVLALRGEVDGLPVLERARSKSRAA